MKPTPEQALAIQTQGRALVVEAGAGTGKTWVLVQRFIHLLETHPDWPLESILAITFTEKAAREMRTRLRQAIEGKAREMPEQDRWQEHRLNLDRMRVSTIHSLCSRILRENAVAVGIDPHFQVLDEQEADLLKEEAIRKTIQTLDEKNDPALALLVSLRVYDLRNEMEGMLQKRGTLHHLFHDLSNPEGMLNRWELGLEEMRTAVWETQLWENPKLVQVIQSLLGIPINDPEDVLAGTVRLAQEGCRAYFKEDLSTAVKAWLTIGLRGGKQANWGGKEAFADLRDGLKTLRAAAQAYEKAGGLLLIDEMDQAAAQHLQLWRSLWDLLDSVYTEIKTVKQALDFDDLELLTKQLLHTRPHGERLRGFLAEISHLMVDEFQDTNPIQQRIVYALAPPEQSGKLFVVGDAKQSIYRFRQAQVSIFNQTAKKVKEFTGHEATRLSTSFRSHHGLIQAMNDLFNVVFASPREKRADFETVPGPLIASRSTLPGLQTPVEMLLLPVEDPAGEGRLNMEEARIWEAGWIGQRLLALKEDRFLVWDKDEEVYRPFEYKDAAVLFRATTQLPLYEAAFKDLGLPYLTVSGRGYYDRPEVRDLIALLAALANPADDLNLAAALRSPLFSLSDETLYRLRWHDSQKTEGGRSAGPLPYRQALSQPPENDQPALVRRAMEILEHLWEQANRIDVWQLLRTSLDLTAYEAVMAISDGEHGRQLSNVNKFVALARQRGGQNPAGFLRQLRDLQTREAREGEALGHEPESGAVQLMSIHAAKGLEFPVVVLADLGRGKRTGFGSPYLLHDPAFGIVCKVRDTAGDWVAPAGYSWGKWMHEAMEEAESKRLLYVACTRAADLLIMVGKLGERNSWLAEILDAWSINADGPAAENLLYEDYGLMIYRPETPPEILQAREKPAPQRLPDIREIPPLARSLPGELERRPIAVTHWVRSLRDEGITQDGLRPAIWQLEILKKEQKTPRRLVGKIVHKALAQWTLLADEEGKLLVLLETLARQEGVSEEMLPDAVRRASDILSRLRNHPIYERVNRATRRYHELPFTLDAPQGILQGVIDLLYQDDYKEWHLVDWKTDWAPESEIEKIAERYQMQLELYADAVEKSLGVRPQACFWFLVPKIISYPLRVGYK